MRYYIVKKSRTARDYLSTKRPKRGWRLKCPDCSIERFSAKDYNIAERGMCPNCAQRLDWVKVETWKYIGKTDSGG